MILGNDGGATISFNGGKTWSTQNNQPTAQFYRVATDDRFPYWVYGSQQDNSSVAIPSGVPGTAIDSSDWHSVGGGESGWIAPTPDGTRRSSSPASTAARSRATTTARQETREIMAWPQLADGHATKDLKYRFQWNAPIVDLAARPEHVLYHASQVLLRSRDEGETWEEMSPGPDAQRQGEAGEVRRADHAPTSRASRCTTRSSRWRPRRTKRA